MATLSRSRHLYRVDLRRSGDAKVVVFSGDLDWRSAPALDRAVDFLLPAPRLLIDLRSAGRIDAAGTASLVRAWLECTEGGAELAVALDDRVETAVLAGAGLEGVITLLRTDAEVEAWVRRPLPQGRVA